MIWPISILTCDRYVFRVWAIWLWLISSFPNWTLNCKQTCRYLVECNDGCVPVTLLKSTQRNKHDDNIKWQSYYTLLYLLITCSPHLYTIGANKWWWCLWYCLTLPHSPADATVSHLLSQCISGLRYRFWRAAKSDLKVGLRNRALLIHSFNQISIKHCRTIMSLYR